MDTFMIRNNFFFSLWIIFFPRILRLSKSRFDHQLIIFIVCHLTQFSTTITISVVVFFIYPRTIEKDKIPWRYTDIRSFRRTLFFKLLLPRWSRLFICMDHPWTKIHNTSICFVEIKPFVLTILNKTIKTRRIRTNPRSIELSS